MCRVVCDERRLCVLRLVVARRGARRARLRRHGGEPAGRRDRLGARSLVACGGGRCRRRDGSRGRAGANAGGAAARSIGEHGPPRGASAARLFLWLCGCGWRSLAGGSHSMRGVACRRCMDCWGRTCARSKRAGRTCAPSACSQRPSWSRSSRRSARRSLASSRLVPALPRLDTLCVFIHPLLVRSPPTWSLISRACLLVLCSCTHAALPSLYTERRSLIMYVYYCRI